MITDEEKKLGIWEFQGKKFKRCPQCDKAMLAEWSSHNCGWGKQEYKPTELEMPKEEDIRLLSTTIVSESIEDAKNILSNLFKKEDGDYYNIDHIIAVADGIRRTKLFFKMKK